MQEERDVAVRIPVDDFATLEVGEPHVVHVILILVAETSVIVPVDEVFLIHAVLVKELGATASHELTGAVG